jgi:DNA-binding CsgD family transcriptional regulator
MVYLSAPFAAPHSKPRHLRVLRPAQSAQQPSFSQVQLLQAVMEGFMDGILIINFKGEILEANSRARELCQLSPMSQVLPRQISEVCDALVESQNLFPGQWIIPESEAVIGGVSLRVRVRWLNPDGESSERQGCNYLLITLEDRQETLQNVAIADIQKYELTTREAEVWHRRLQGQSYQSIASELYITQNTVKKHVKNILAKRRENGDLWP